MLGILGVHDMFEGQGFAGFHFAGSGTRIVGFVIGSPGSSCRPPGQRSAPSPLSRRELAHIDVVPSRDRLVPRAAGDGCAQDAVR